MARKFGTIKEGGSKEYRKEDKKYKYWTGFIAWILINSILYLLLGFLLEKIFGSYPFYQVKFLSLLILGLVFSISTRIIYSEINKRRIYLDSSVFVFWTFSYTFAIWFSELLRRIFIEDIGLSFVSNQIVGVLFVGLGIHLIIKIFQRIDFGFDRSRFLRAPSQIISGIILIIIGVLFFRFSGVIFLQWLRWSEGLAWSWIIGLFFIIGGVLTLIAWWRNNVLQHRVGLKIGKW